MKGIPYARQFLDEEDIRGVVDVLKSDYLTTGPKVGEFEEALCIYTGAKYTVAVNSGTSALDIAVGALELPAGSEIITPPFTFAASSNCVLYNNCKPVFADIDPKTYNIDPEQIKKTITKKTKAIVYVDYAGQPCNIDEIKEIAEKHDLYLIEDACHALGAEYKKKRLGSFADMTVFSFHAVKHITTGEGGAVTTNDERFYERLRRLRNHGIDTVPSERKGYQYDMKVLGRNYRITDFQCALGISQLKKIDEFIRRREDIARMYNKEFQRIPGITTPYVKPDVKHAWHLYTLLLDKKLKRDEFFNSMKQRSIGVNVHYIPIYKFTYYKRFNPAPDFPVTEDVYSKIITLPLFSCMSNEEVKYVVEAVKECSKVDR